MTPFRETRFELARWVTTRAPNSKFNLGTSEFQGRRAHEAMPDDDLNVGSGIFDGDLELRQIIADRYGVGIENIALTAGASEANFLVCHSFLKGGGTVVVEHPVYPPLLELGKFFNARIRPWLREFENDYSVDLESLKDLVNDSTIIIFTNLHNPSGVSIPQEYVRAISEIANNAGAHILCDEIFRDFVSERTVATASCGDNCITSSSVSKVQGFGGLRLGWTVASKELTDTILGEREMASVCCSRLDEEMGKRILTRKEFTSEALARAEKNMSIVKDWIESTEGVDWVEPHGGILCFPRLDGISDSKRFAEFLLKEYGTLVSPGHFFGGEGHIRLGLGGDEETIKGGLAMSNSMKKALSSPSFLPPPRMNESDHGN